MPDHNFWSNKKTFKYTTRRPTKSTKWQFEMGGVRIGGGHKDTPTPTKNCMGMRLTVNRMGCVAHVGMCMLHGGCGWGACGRRFFRLVKFGRHGTWCMVCHCARVRNMTCVCVRPPGAKICMGVGLGVLASQLGWILYRGPFLRKYIDF